MGLQRGKAQGKPIVHAHSNIEVDKINTHQKWLQIKLSQNNIWTLWVKPNQTKPNQTKLKLNSVQVQIELANWN